MSMSLGERFLTAAGRAWTHTARGIANGFTFGFMVAALTIGLSCLPQNETPAQQKEAAEQVTDNLGKNKTSEGMAKILFLVLYSGAGGMLGGGLGLIGGVREASRTLRAKEPKNLPS